jgi:DNA-binding PadR family transcriptional regulator
MEGVAHALLALLADGDRFGLELKDTFEVRTASAWPLNIGQVYTTLQRLTRDGYVEEVVDPQVSRHRRYRLTDVGRARLESWFATAQVDRGQPRDERVIKVVMAMASSGRDALPVVRAERAAALAALARFGPGESPRSEPSQRRSSRREAPTVAEILSEAERCRIEGVIAWLDGCEAVLGAVSVSP